VEVNLTHPFKQLKTIHQRHLDVEKYQRWVKLLNRFQAFDTIGELTSHVNLWAVPGQLQRQQVNVVGFVINENSAHGFHH
jgi:hypothetical protein